MGQVLKTRVVKMGNSRGVRIPKVVLDQLDFGGEVQMEVQADSLILRPVRSPREGWDEQFKMMAQNGDDALLWEDASLTDWDEKEWEW